MATAATTQSNLTFSFQAEPEIGFVWWNSRIDSFILLLPPHTPLSVRRLSSAKIKTLLAHFSSRPERHISYQPIQKKPPIACTYSHSSIRRGKYCITFYVTIKRVFFETIFLVETFRPAIFFRCIQSLLWCIWVRKTSEADGRAASKFTLKAFSWNCTHFTGTFTHSAYRHIFIQFYLYFQPWSQSG